MALKHEVVVYGVFLTPEEIKERETWHETEWLEWELPKEVEKAATKFIKAELKKFYKKCKCGRCQLRKK